MEDLIEVKRLKTDDVETGGGALSEGGVRELLFFFQGNIGEVVDGSLEDSISVSRWQKSSWFSLRLSVRTFLDLRGRMIALRVFSQV
jgi:hypothetical protein